MSIKPTRRNLLTAAALTPVAIAAGSLTAESASASTVDTALEWYDLTVTTITEAGSPAQVTNSRTWAIAWLAAARAQQRETAPEFRQAALASAIHSVLSAQVPARATVLDAALTTTLSRLRNRPGKHRGVTAGREEAQALLGERAGDGLDPASVNPPYDAGPAAPGVWQPTPPSYTPGQQSGTRFARPFLLPTADAFRPGPPPALGSARNIADLEEVRLYGGLNSTVRTQAQADTALFWYGSSQVLYNPVLRAALAGSHRSLVWRTTLVALFHIALVDTQIATSDTKYHYHWWRPVTALAGTGWQPFHVTPSHPDYVSGHNIYSGAAEGVLTDLVGARTAPYTVVSPSSGTTRTYTDWATPSRENVDARVWSGIHTRSADEQGIVLGKKVARHTLREAWRLF
ncbi:hypothetical protein Afil01_54620 [Actinorhabdospora filicis]|uniref:PAP2 superfamily protein n=1 Tax=Actinorhabdospora filicis TaxID=1785913 RepID=A0A9W6SRJ6_9ACTN|nr:vanadium-dependent haloperoxidase [Actinorhabdospora filicis]GLZ80655.1 hypothetical protein Afil01_54620 [Actinorhabdospora filicis]